MLAVLRLVVALCALLAASGAARASTPDGPPNVLVVVLDDVGVDKIGAYGEAADAGPTPVCDALASIGQLYRNAWSYPVCSPARASVLTGRHPFRHGVGVGVGDVGGDYVVDEGEVTLPELLGRRGHLTACVGKWHLAPKDMADRFMHPIAFGFDRHLGPIANVASYFSWKRNLADARGAVQLDSDAYVTTQEVDDALATIEAFEGRPWFVWLALTAPHQPLAPPPAHLHTQGDLTGAGAPTLYRAVLEAADAEIGRLLASIRPAVLARTYVIVFGDNGTYFAAKTPPFAEPGNSKGSCLEGGVNVPLLVVGPDVVPGEVDGLVSTVDLFATILELTHTPGPPSDVALDSVSLLPYLADPNRPSLRPTVFSQLRSPNGFPAQPLEDLRGLRDGRYKLVRRSGSLFQPHPVVFFDLQADPFETSSLVDDFGVPLPDTSPEAIAAYEALDAELEALLGDG